MPEMTYAGAIDAALDLAMTRDERVVVWGEDVAMLRRELHVRHGESRVRDTPISESAFLGAGVTAAMGGLRPVVEVMLVDFVAVAFDQLLNHAAKYATFSGGDWTVPLVVRASCGGGYGDGGLHSQVLWGLLAGVPGLDVVVPSTPADAAGLLLTAIATDGPVVFLEHKLLSAYWLDYLGGASREGLDFDVPEAGASGQVADPPEPVPLGVAAMRREGGDVALISLGVGVHRCLEAAERLALLGVEATVVDLRSVAPLDRETIERVAGDTGRVVVVDEDYVRGGLSGEIAALIAEVGLSCRFGRVAVDETIPYARDLERQVLPSVERVIEAVAALE